MATALVTSACAAAPQRDGATVARGPGEATSTSPAPAAGAPTTVASTQTAAPRRVTQTTRPAAPPTPSADPVAPAGAPASNEDGSDDSGRSGPPGALARTLLRPTPARTLTLEIISQPGAAVRSATTSLVERTLQDVAAKPVSIVATAGPQSATTTWDEASIAAYADRSARATPTASTAIVRFLALHGGFGPDDNAIGVAVRGDVFALFVDRVNDSGTPLVDAGTVEQAVAVHELGHLLGLVDIAIDRNRDDPDHPFHSRNRASVMFWAIDTDLVGQILGGPPPRSFDRDDEADLAALRSGA